MTKRTAASVVVLLGLLGIPRVFVAFQDANPSWHTHRSADGRYSAELPGTPRRQREPVRVPGYDLHLDLDMVELSWGAFAVGFCDYPDEIVSAAPAEDLLLGCEQGWLQTTGATLRSSGETTVEGRSGREVVASGQIEHGVPAVFHARFVLDRNRLYVLQVVGDPERVDPAHVERFYASFDLE